MYLRITGTLLFFALLLTGPSASADEAAPLETYSEHERAYWAYKPRTHPAIPSFENEQDRLWSANPIDAFILRKLRDEGLQPSPVADKITLIRRAYYDMTGLPPSPAEVDAFLKDTSPGAWSNLVERLLASPHYGEKWGQHWLDVVRYAETDGFEYDRHRPDAWRFRDYVIQAFNQDKPYDQFVTEQLAGDEVAGDDVEARAAAGLQRMGALRLNAGNQEVASSRNEVLTEMTNMVGQAFLGLTVGCARCHNHRFDPIRQSDYYRLQAYFGAAQNADVPLAAKAEQDAWAEQTKALRAETRRLQQQMKNASGAEQAEIEKKLDAIEDKMPAPLPGIFTVSSNPEKLTPVHMLARGDYLHPGAQVGPRPLGVLLPEGTPELDPKTPNPRTKLAQWLTDPDHPLTARVMVNRVWHHHFGRGIVETPNDFGRMGGQPTHPELLDYLSNWYVDGGWKLKPLHRLILLSNTYRQASEMPGAKVAAEKDPENKLLWKYSRRRLTAEEIRDSVLVVSGTLNTKAGGPSVMVPVDQELVNLLYKPQQWVAAKEASEHNRRSIYLIAKRNLRLPFMEVFDAPDMQISCARREASTHAPQALELMNGAFTNQLAKALADRLATEAGDDRAAQVALAYRLATGRLPTPEEERLALEFLKNQPISEFALATINVNAFLYVN